MGDINEGKSINRKSVHMLSPFQNVYVCIIVHIDLNNYLINAYPNRNVSLT